ncbi:MAG: tetratricopeptide repeat protein [Rhodospirillaceae bacterium]|nr:tetratricopeptide repeat protein [Rhodospirillaceae bacterium]
MDKPVKAKLDHAVALLQQGRAAEAEQELATLLAEYPNNFLVLYNYAVVSAQRGALDKAERLMAQAIALQPEIAPAQLAHGKILMDLNRPAEALAQFERYLAKAPNDPAALNDRGTALLRLARNEEAVREFRRALQIQPDLFVARYNLASALENLGRRAETLAEVDRIIAQQPAFAEAHFFRGNLLGALGRRDDALEAFNRVLTLHPGNAKAANNRGSLLIDLGRMDEGLASIELALRIDANNLEALVNRGRALAKLGRVAEELACYDKVLALRPDFSEAWLSRGVALQGLKRFDEALASLERALTLNPRHAKGLQAKGNLLVAMRRLPEAAAAFDASLALNPDDANAWHNRALAVRLQNRHDEAAKSFARTLALKPDYPYARGALHSARLHCCDWTDFSAASQAISAAVAAGEKADTPFAFLCHSPSAAHQLMCARTFATEKYAAGAVPWSAAPYRNDKIHLAYVSADLKNHATAHLLAGVLENHDRSRFDLTAVSLSPGDGSAMERRLRASFDRFIDATTMSDADVVATLRNLRTEIAVDLKGFTNDARAGIFAQRAAPVQVNFLGYPGTWGAACMDYIVADATIIPPEHEGAYSEKVVRLPDTYQPNDRKRVIASMTLTRGLLKLPEQGFVFCSFNNNYKITPMVFDVWVRLLSRVPGSVLWLLESNAAATRNLKMEAAQRGVDAARLIFAPAVLTEQHLARQAFADLFLDTVPVNAHTTASDALWAGLPVLTILGTTFAGRVAASLLNAIEMPEMIARDLAEYETKAFELATVPGKITETKAKLARNRDTAALFDTDRFRRHLEAAFTVMAQRLRQGLPPETFSVPAQPGATS